MELIFDAKTFKPLSGFLAGLIPREETIPGESLVRIAGDGDRAVFLAGTAHEAARVSCLLISGEGRYTAPAKTLFPLLNDWKGNVKLMSEDDLLGETKSTLLSLEGDDEQATKARFYKTEDKTELVTTIPTPVAGLAVDTSLFADSLQRAKQAAGDVPPTYSAGILVKLVEKTLDIVSTDGKMLFQRTIEVVPAEGISVNFVLPIESIRHVLHFLSLPDTAEQVQVFDTKSFLIIRSGHDWLSIRTLEPTYVNYVEIMGKKIDYAVAFDLPVRDVDKYMRRARLVHESRSSTPSVSLSRMAEHLVVQAASVGLGTYEEQIPMAAIDLPNADPVEVLLNIDFMQRMARACAGDRIKVEMPKELNPVRITNPDDSSITGLLMVIRA